MGEFIHKKEKNKIGFTLIEVLIAVSIVAVLAAVGISKFPLLVENGKKKAAERVLKEMQASQRRYFQDTKIFADDITKLDTEWKNVTGFTLQAYDDASQVATASRSPEKDYELAISSDGELTCSGSYCEFLGYANTGGGDDSSVDGGDDSSVDGGDDSSYDLSYENFLAALQDDSSGILDYIQANPEQIEQLLTTNPELGELLDFLNIAATDPEKALEMYTSGELDELVEKYPELKPLLEKLSG